MHLTNPRVRLAPFTFPIVRFVRGVLISLFLMVSYAPSQQPGCDAVLAFQTEIKTSDYSAQQAWMYVNAEYYYELRKNSEGNTDHGGLNVPGYFEGEYGSSHSKEEFREKVNKRLTKEGFSMNVQEAKSEYRHYLDPSQISAWESCAAESGRVGLFGKPSATEPFSLKVEFRPQRGLASAKLLLDLTGGTINGKKTLAETFEGIYDKTFTVIPDRLAPDESSRAIIINANIGGNTDSLTFTARKPQPLPAEEPRPIPRTKKIRLVLYDKRQTRAGGYLVMPGKIASYEVPFQDGELVSVDGWVVSGNPPARTEFGKIEVSRKNEHTLLLVMEGAPQGGEATLGIDVSVTYREPN